MPESSVELPIDRVLEACEKKFTAAHELAHKQWEEHPEKHDAWLAEEGCHNGRLWAAGKSQDWGPSKLYGLCVAAKESGETKIRVTVGDFQQIDIFYRAKQAETANE